VKTLHGSYLFDNQQYILLDGTSTNHLSFVLGLNSNNYSEGLETFIEYWIGDLSYRQLSFLLAQHTGHSMLSPVGVKDYIERKALAISNLWLSSSISTLTISPKISIPSSIDIYNPLSGEVILMMDDVGVKAQKPHKKVERLTTDAKRIDTTIVLVSVVEQVGKMTSESISPLPILPVADATKAQKEEKTAVTDLYMPLTEGINEAGEVIYPIEQAIYDTLNALYLSHTPERDLPIVAITDGARSIRLALQFVFGMLVCIVLDWYHLQLKIKNLMSMIAPSKDLKTLYIKDLNALLWRGKTDEAIDYLLKIPQVKNQEKWVELIGYIQKHKAEIIDYEKRQKAGKTIGSGRCEKANDTIVAHRQKKKGMAWSRTGSKALAIIKTFQLQKNIIKKAA
jgi:Uncharacterised protein family (UPF0236)